MDFVLVSQALNPHNVKNVVFRREKQAIKTVAPTYSNRVRLRKSGCACNFCTNWPERTHTLARLHARAHHQNAHALVIGPNGTQTAS